ncbi:MAG: trehalase family glycosidase [Bacteriovoracaceae bacterium]
MASDVMTALLKEEDTDGDKKITILDKGDKVFVFQGKQITGTYYLSNLLQELALHHKVNLSRVKENPLDRVSRMIREEYWDGLTRVIDKEHLKEIIPDTKVKTDALYLYVPENDSFDSVSGVIIKRLPPAPGPKYVHDLNGKHGLLALAKNAPYVVPGGRFNEMYGWDSYFESIGLMLDQRPELVDGMVKNFTYEITHYGKILNANRTYYLNRSQPPFFTSMILLQKNRDKAAIAAAIQEYETVWMGPDRLTATGLSRYHGKGLGVPPEVETGHYLTVFEPYAKKLGMKANAYQEKYDRGEIRNPELDTFFEHDACVRESGHDTTYRFRYNGKDACADFVTVDLNTLLYKIELDLAELVPEKRTYFRERAQKRKELIMKYLWDEKTGYFFDYHVPSGTRSSYISATGLYPLMIKEKLLSKEEAKRAIAFGLKHLEGPGGIFSTAKVSRESVKDSHERQWDWPNGWAPHQMIIWQGLLNYDKGEDAERLISKWILMIAENARDFNGTVPEKFDVEKRSHAVFAEYGNVGTHFSYITKEGFGWMNASYQYGLHLLPEKKKNELRKKLIR